DDPGRHDLLGERSEDCLTETAFRSVVLDRHETTGLAGRGCHRRCVDRLDRVEIDDTSRDPVGREALRSGDRLVEGDACADQGEDVRWTRPNDLASPDRERLVGTV